MKQFFRLLFITFFALTITLTQSSAQNSLIRYADKQFDLENFQHAAEVYEEAYAKKETYRTAVKLAETFKIIGEYTKSYEWWKKTVAFKESTKEDYAAYLLAALQSDQGIDVDQLLKERGYTQADFPQVGFDTIKKLNASKANVKLTPLAGANSTGSDYGFAQDQSGKTYFSSDRGTVRSSNMPSIRLDAKNNKYSSEKSAFNDREFYKLYAMDKGGKLSTISPDLKNALHMTDPSFMKEKGLLFYTVFLDQKKGMKETKLENFPQIYFGKLGENGVLSESKSLPINNQFKYGVMNPYVDEAAKRIYFASNMPGGYGGYDLYYITYDADLNFGEAVNLGSVINTAANESHPSRLDGKFYFSSKGHPGLGGMDIFSADFKAGDFSNVTNLGKPYNGVRDDFSFVASADGKQYLSSNRVGGMGLDDIYQIDELYKKLLARVIDCDGNVITTELDAILKENGSTQTVPVSRTQKGELTAELAPETDYSLSINKKGYFTVNDNSLTTKGLQGEVLEREYRLAAIPYRLPVYVDLIYYDLDKSFIRQDAQSNLDHVGKLMTQHNYLNLLVAAHTDSRASDTYNQALSQRRADAVRDYLAKYNVAPERVRLEWFGEEKITNDCGDGVPCPEVEHQLNRRSELVLEAFSDPEKQYELPQEFVGSDPCDPAALLGALQSDLNQVPTIYFDYDRSKLRPIHKKELEKVSIMLKRMPNLQLYIAGHTDQRGTDTYNKKLSERRSKAVKDYLVNRGLEASRLHDESFGKSQPATDCGDKPCNEEIHQRNRRVELRLR
jgi:outer membrane protein OmpA-like peptidoglycan-associated protein